MLVEIQNLLGKEDVAQIRTLSGQGPWLDGASTTGTALQNAKKNAQLDRACAGWATIEQALFQALGSSQDVLRAARPAKLGGLMISRYEPGDLYGEHFDNALLPIPGGFRTDLSFTVFLSDPETYDGGALEIDLRGNGEHFEAFKPKAGDAVLYPTDRLHRVSEVTKGERLAAVGWIQSHVRSVEDREVLSDLEEVAKTLYQADPSDPKARKALRVFHHLMRRWSDH
ncbi:MAG: Fe2+-dependent dioxygenase [Pseudomonadota bacterium]